MGKTHFQTLLDDFHVKDEQELEDKLFKDWDVEYCRCCGRRISLIDASWINNFPYCKNCVE
jgi:hypothetical protein